MSEVWLNGVLVLQRHVRESRIYRLGGPLEYFSDSQQALFRVGVGFETDGASVPRVFWAYASPFAGLHAPAVILHDALYTAHWERRKDSDEVFYEAMLSLGIRKSKAWLMYRSVRVGGGFAWNGKTEEQIVRAQELLEVI